MNWPGVKHSFDIRKWQLPTKPARRSPTAAPEPMHAVQFTRCLSLLFASIFTASPCFPSTPRQLSPSLCQIKYYYCFLKIIKSMTASTLHKIYKTPKRKEKYKSRRHKHTLFSTHKQTSSLFLTPLRIVVCCVRLYITTLSFGHLDIPLDI